MKCYGTAVGFHGPATGPYPVTVRGIVVTLPMHRHPDAPRRELTI